MALPRALFHTYTRVLHEKEQFHEESAHLKRTMSMLKLENNNLKGKVASGEKELAKKDKEIKKLTSRISSPTPGFYKIAKVLSSKVNGKSGPAAMKKKINELQKKNKILREELKILKKCMKVTTTQELVAEVKAYSDECLRLRNMLEEKITKKTYENEKNEIDIDKKMEEQNDLINKLKTENKELLEKVKEMENMANNLKKKRSHEESGLSETELSEQRKEIEQLKKEIEELKNKEASPTNIEELEKAKTAFRKQEKEHEKTIRDLEMELVK